MATSRPYSVSILRLSAMRSRPTAALLLLMAAILVSQTGCVATPFSDFSIVGEQSRYSDRAFILSRNNLLSLHSGGGLITSAEEGFYANPAYLDGRWFLLVENVTSLGEKDTAANRLRNIIRLTLSVDGETFSVASSEHDYSTRNQVDAVSLWGDDMTPGRTQEFARETATFQLTEEQFTRIFNATQLTVWVVGSAHAMVFEQDEIAASFQPNLSAFYDAAKLERVGSIEY